MNRSDLSKQQKRVLDETLDEGSSRILVLGGPGSGKTTVALWAAREYLESSGNQGARALFLTFSRAAVRQIYIAAGGSLAGTGQAVEVSTFHGLAYRIVRAFGRYDGRGSVVPKLQTATRQKLLGAAPDRLTYDDLIPDALAVLSKGGVVRDLWAKRWDLVICDEVQDTDSIQWELVDALAPSEVILLGDANQMIYTFLDGVSPERFAEVTNLADSVIELEEKSHRDPSGSIPALAKAVMSRDFDHEAIKYAVDEGILKIISGVEPNGYKELLPPLLRDLRSDDCVTVGVFAHSNAAVADLGNELSDAGVPYVLVGIPEAHAEAIGVMITLCCYSVDQTTADEVRESLALFLTSCVRGNPPDLAYGFLGTRDLPEGISRTLDELLTALHSTDLQVVGDLAQLAIQAWPGLRIRVGTGPWRRATSYFSRFVRDLANEAISPNVVDVLRERIEAYKSEALIDRDIVERGRLSLMNFHQTKGREADGIVHIYRADDYLGKEKEPFKEASRLLYVALTRARKRIVVVLPANPHPLVAPLADLPKPVINGL
ncbi:MAG: UvrD-helicase domain-containing protein [Dehalococcoidia bacterium]